MANTPQLAEHTLTVPLPTEPAPPGLFANDPLLSGVAIAKDLWADEHAGGYLARIGNDW